MGYRWKPGPILLKFIGAAGEVGFRFPLVVGPVEAPLVHIEPSTAPSTSITSILMLQDALNLKLNLTVVSELRWRRDEHAWIRVLLVLSHKV